MCELSIGQVSIIGWRNWFFVSIANGFLLSEWELTYKYWRVSHQYRLVIGWIIDFHIDYLEIPCNSNILTQIAVKSINSLPQAVSEYVDYR